MAITLSGTGGLFTRLGAIGGRLNEVNNFRGTTTLGPGITTIDAQYHSALQDAVDGLYAARDSYRGTHGAFLSYLRALAKTTLIEMANADTPLVTQDVPTALALLIAQMTTSVDSVKRSVPGKTITAASGNVGNPTVIMSLVNVKNIPTELIFPETMTAKVTTDSANTATAGLESVNVRGVLAQADSLSWDWPAGSGANVTFSMADAQTDQTATDLLNNGSMDTFTVANTPDNFSVDIGSVGTHVFSEASVIYRTGKALKITGDASNLTELNQTFGSSTYTTSTLLPLTQYAFNCYLKVSAVPSGGVLTFSLVDGSGTVINDASGAANTVSKTLSAATTSYVALNGFFRTPASLPSTYKFRIKLTTALDNAKSVYVDELALVKTNVLYTGGPSLNFFRGTTDVLIGDSWSLALTNTFGEFQKLAEKFFGLRALGLLLPSNASPTIADGLIA